MYIYIYIGRPTLSLGLCTETVTESPRISVHRSSSTRVLPSHLRLLICICIYIYIYMYMCIIERDICRDR